MSDIVNTPFNKLYEHFSGEIYFLQASAVHHKTGEEILILKSLSDSSKQIFVETSKFFDEHPELKVPRFQLITPTKKV